MKTLVKYPTPVVANRFEAGIHVAIIVDEEVGSLLASLFSAPVATNDIGDGKTLVSSIMNEEQARELVKMCQGFRTGPNHWVNRYYALAHNIEKNITACLEGE